jgi:hypothetical protein
MKSLIRQFLKRLVEQGLKQISNILLRESIYFLVKLNYTKFFCNALDFLIHIHILDASDSIPLPLERGAEPDPADG